MQLCGGQCPVVTPTAGSEDANHAQVESKRPARPLRVIETIGDLIRGRCRVGSLTQLVQPAADWADQRVAFGPLDRRWMHQSLQQDRGGVLAVPCNRTAAARRQRDRIVFADIDKDAVGAQPRPLDRGDQALAALVGTQIAHRPAALVGAPLVDLVVKTTPDVGFIKREPLGQREPGGRKGGIVQRTVRFANWSSRPLRPAAVAVNQCR